MLASFHVLIGLLAGIVAGAVCVLGARALGIGHASASLLRRSLEVVATKTTSQEQNLMKPRPSPVRKEREKERWKEIKK